MCLRPRLAATQTNLTDTKNEYTKKYEISKNREI